jgi:acyl-CoA dehydrogenase
LRTARTTTPALDRACREIVHRLGAEGFLNQCCVSEPGGRFDVRSLALSRETLARHGGLADFCFAMQGLGTGPISLFGNEAQKRKYLPPVMRGKRIAAFATFRAAGGKRRRGNRDRGRALGQRVRAERHQDLDLERGACRSLRRFRAHRRRRGSKGLSAFIVDAERLG